MSDAVYLRSSRSMGDAVRWLDAQFDGRLPRLWPFGGYLSFWHHLVGRVAKGGDGVVRVRATYLGWLNDEDLRPRTRSLEFDGRLEETADGCILSGTLDLPTARWAADGAIVGLILGVVGGLVTEVGPAMTLLYAALAAPGLAVLSAIGEQIEAWWHWADYEVSGQEMTQAFEAALGPEPPSSGARLAGPPAAGDVWRDAIDSGELPRRR